MESSNEIRELICDIGQRIYMREMGAANDGNISVLSDDGTIFCTPTGVSKGFMTPKMICRLDRDGEIIESGEYRPSTEVKMHLCVYGNREDVGAVVHAHPLYATVNAVCGRSLTQQIMPEATMFLGEVPLAPYALPSTNELAESITPYFESHDALLLENHGALSFGDTLHSAYFKMESLEYYAKVVYLSEAYGGAHELNQHHIDNLMNVRRTQFKQPGRHPFL